MIGRKNILVVDDDTVFKLITRKMFEKSGDRFNGFFVGNGLEGVNFLKNAIENEDSLSIPDIILLDIEMPVMNGWEFMEAFLSIPEEKTEKIHIYTVSSSIAEEDKKRAKSFQQIKGFISKPLTVSILQDIAAAHSG